MKIEFEKYILYFYSFILTFSIGYVEKFTILIGIFNTFYIILSIPIRKPYLELYFNGFMYHFHFRFFIIEFTILKHIVIKQ
jgi:hypothetical protein